MLKITVCISSACHLKGSREIVERLQALIKKEKMTEEIELKGTFCLGNCQKDGVSITIDDQYHNVLKDDIDTFFEQYILNH